MENQAINRRVTSAPESKPVNDTLNMLPHGVDSADGDHTLKVRLPPIFVIMPSMSFADN